MFKPTSNKTVAPVTTPMFTGWADNVTITTILADFRATDPNTIATIGAIFKMVCTAANAGDGVQDDLRTNARKAFRGVGYANMMDKFNNPGANENTDNDHNIRAINANGDAALNWLVDLINAAKKKPLTDDNVEGYFSMLGHSGTKPGVVARFINQLQAFFPDLIGDADFMQLLSPGIWTAYRNTRVSTGKILRELLPMFNDLGITQPNDQVEKAIVACSDTPWDVNLSLQIPNRIKAYGCIYLQVAGTPIDNWHQGNKAIAEIPVSRIRTCKEIFRRYLEIKNNVDPSSINTLADFKTNASIKGFF